MFIPFVWGLGVLAAAMTLTFRRGPGIVGLAVGSLAFGSGFFFPLELLPNWIASAMRYNPMALAVEGIRRPLLAGGWEGVWLEALVLAPMSSLTLLLGIGAFRLALRRERRLGTLGLY